MMKQGFTLIELLVAVLIIGVLSAVALPQYTKAVQKARAAAALPMGKTVRDAQNVYYLSNNVYAEDPAELDVEYTCPKEFTCDFTDSNTDPKFTMTSTRLNGFGLVFSYATRKSSLGNKNYCWADRDKEPDLTICKSYGPDMNINPTRYTAEIK